MGGIGHWACMGGQGVTCDAGDVRTRWCDADQPVPVVVCAVCAVCAVGVCCACMCRGCAAACCAWCLCVRVYVTVCGGGGGAWLGAGCCGVALRWVALLCVAWPGDGGPWTAVGGWRVLLCWPLGMDWWMDAWCAGCLVCGMPVWPCVCRSYVWCSRGQQRAQGCNPCQGTAAAAAVARAAAA